jgi:hypothetical protein
MQAGEIPQFTPLQHHEGGSRRGSHEYSPTPGIEGAQQRKRTFSSISNEFSSPAYQPQRPPVGGWSSAEAPRHLPPPSSYQLPASGEQAQASFRTHYSPNGLAPQAIWTNAPDTAQRTATSFGHAEPNYPDHKVDWDDNLING